jgi:hypothetical protein
MNKKYYFIVDYNTKYGTIKKGESLTGRLSSASKTPKVMFDFYEITDPVKAESGEGIFSINETDLKNFASDVAPKKDDVKNTSVAPKKDDVKNTSVAPKKDDVKNTSESNGFKSWSMTKKTIVVGSSLAVVGLAVWYFIIRKK